MLNSKLGSLSVHSPAKYICEIFSQQRGSTWPAYRYTNQTNTSPELIVAGCSFTYGNGVLIEETWGNRLSNLMGVDSVTIGLKGWSMVDIVDGIFSHIRSNGNPKFIAILATELIRGREALDGFNVRSKSFIDQQYPCIRTITMGASASLQDSVKYSKRPHLIEDIMMRDSYIYRSLAHLNHLILYCKSTGIPLVWGTWDDASSSLFNFVRSNKDLDHIDLGNYVDIPTYPTGANKQNTPLLALSCTIDSHAGLYDLGLDEGVHAGSHYHAHWAEDFYNKFLAIEDVV